VRLFFGEADAGIATHLPGLPIDEGGNGMPAYKETPG